MAGTPHRMWWWWGTWIFACHNRWMGPRASFAAGNFRRNFEDPTWLWGLTFPTVRSSPRLREACGHRRSSPWMSGLEILRVSTEGQAISGFLFLRGSERSAGDLTHTPHPPNPSCTVSFFFFFALFGNLSLVSLMAKEMFYGAPQKKKTQTKMHPVSTTWNCYDCLLTVISKSFSFFVSGLAFPNPQIQAVFL